MKHFLIKIVMVVIPFIVLYLITAFAFNDLDFYNWSERIRLLICFIGGFSGFALVSLYNDFIN